MSSCQTWLSVVPFVVERSPGVPSVVAGGKLPGHYSSLQLLSIGLVASHGDSAEDGACAGVSRAPSDPVAPTRQSQEQPGCVTQQLSSPVLRGRSWGQHGLLPTPHPASGKPPRLGKERQWRPHLSPAGPWAQVLASPWWLMNTRRIGCAEEEKSCSEEPHHPVTKSTAHLLFLHLSPRASQSLWPRQLPLIIGRFYNFLPFWTGSSFLVILHNFPPVILKKRSCRYDKSSADSGTLCLIPQTPRVPVLVGSCPQFSSFLLNT